jgi:kynureninase
VSQHQVRLLAERFDALDLPPALIRREVTVPLDRVGGFLVLETPHAADLSRRLKEDGVWTDYRGSALRLGPAPYLCGEQLRDAMTRLGEVCRTVQS